MHKRVLGQLSNKNMFYISYTTIGKSFQSNLHSHENLELLLFTDGNGYIQTTNRKIEVKKGDFVIINPNARHCEVSTDLSFYAIGINQINMYLKETFTKKIIHFSLNNKDFSSLQALYTLIFDLLYVYTLATNILVSPTSASASVEKSFSLVYINV